MKKPPILWKVHHQETICETRVFSVLKKQMEMPYNKKMADFFTIEAIDWVNVIAVTADDKVVLVEQYRHGIHELSLEIPGGIISKEADSPEQAAQMELREETGFTSQSWSYLGAVSTNPALFTNRCHLFLAENCVLSDSQDLDEHEQIKVLLKPLDDFLEDVAQGRIHHALVVAAVSKYLLRSRLFDSQ